MFRNLWLASFASNLGTWMHEVGAAWMMTGATSDPRMVSLVAAAANLPIFLLALPAGAMADLIDRRRLIIATQLWLVLCTGVLAALTRAHVAGPWTLLAITFLMAAGNALAWPAMQAIQPETVEKAEVPAAVALGGIGFNLSRVIGPALGGWVVARSGPEAVFALNALSFFGVVGVLAAWRRPAMPATGPREPMRQAMASGLRYVRHSPGLVAALVRVGTTILAGSSLWALLPLVGRNELKLTPAGYGALYGWFGLGAVAGGILLGRIRKRFSAGTIITASAAGIAAQLGALAVAREIHVVRAVMFGGGIAWTLAMISLNIAVLHLAPAWVRSRAAAIYLMVFTGAMSAGSALWGVVAEHVGGPGPALGWAGLALAVSLPAQALWRLPDDATVGDLSPSGHWPAHGGAEAGDPDHDAGPVLIVIEYRVPDAAAAEFATALRALRRVRLRDAATRWSHWRDMKDPTRHLESFVVESWAGHLRQHDRMTIADRAVEGRATAMHEGAEPPTVSHYLAG